MCKKTRITAGPSLVLNGNKVIPIFEYIDTRIVLGIPDTIGWSYSDVRGGFYVRITIHIYQYITSLIGILTLGKFGHVFAALDQSNQFLLFFN